MYHVLQLERRHVPKGAVVSQIFEYSEPLPLTIYRPVSRSSGNSSSEWEIVQGCRERPGKASLMVAEIGPRH